MGCRRLDVDSLQVCCRYGGIYGLVKIILIKTHLKAKGVELLGIIYEECY